jgi:hypothetical protein
MKEPKDYGMTAAKMPKGATSSDMRGERREREVDGVAMGKMDQFNTGRSEKVCYEHKRMPHDQNK